MLKSKLLYAGKTKSIFEMETSDNYIIEYRDDIAALNGLKKGVIPGKGMINNAVSDILFRVLEQNDIRTHYIQSIGDRDMLVKRVGMIPLEIVVRNWAAGKFSRKYNVEEGAKLEPTVLEFFYKDDVLGDPMVNHSHILAFRLATEKQIETIHQLAFRVNEVLRAFFLEHDLILIDVKMEVGYDTTGNIVVADEISPDKCRLWDVHTKQKLDKDLFRDDLGGVEEAYQEILRRLTRDK